MRVINKFDYKIKGTISNIELISLYFIEEEIEIFYKDGSSENIIGVSKIKSFLDIEHSKDPTGITQEIYDDIILNTKETDISGFNYDIIDLI